MRIVIDMNLTPQWVEVFARQGFEAVHWQQVGAPNAPDREIMQWARDNGYIVFTHDLDFGTILAATGADAPSVIQVRTQDVTPNHLEPIIVAALQQYEETLATGALIVVDEGKLRVRVLPIRRLNPFHS